MMIKIIICYILVFAIFGASIRFIVLLLLPAFTGMKRAPYVPSFNSHLKLMAHGLHLKPGAKILDLGCGDGKALRFFTKTFGLKGTGYDINFFAILYGNIVNYLLGARHTKLIKDRFESADLSKYDYIYTYLFPNQMAQIEDRVFDNIGKETIIISNSFQFTKHKPYETIPNTKGKASIFLYKK